MLSVISVHAQNWALFRPGQQNRLGFHRLQYNRLDTINGKAHFKAIRLVQPPSEFSNNFAGMLHSGLLGKELVNNNNGVWSVTANFDMEGPFSGSGRINRRTIHINTAAEPAPGPVYISNGAQTDTIYLPIPGSKVWDAALNDSVKTFILPGSITDSAKRDTLVLARLTGVVQLKDLYYNGPYNLADMPAKSSFYDPQRIINRVDLVTVPYMAAGNTPTWPTTYTYYRWYSNRRETPEGVTVSYIDTVIYRDTYLDSTSMRIESGTYIIPRSDYTTRYAPDTLYGSGSDFDLNLVVYGQSDIRTGPWTMADFNGGKAEVQPGDTLIDMPVLLSSGLQCLAYQMLGYANCYRWYGEGRYRNSSLTYYLTDSGDTYGSRPAILGTGKKLLPALALPYPNPSNGSISISNITAPARMELLNLLGQSVGSYTVNPGESIKLIGLTPGIYRYKIESAGNGVAEGKLVIE
ncbi:MAG: T9SS type A sorting domain-containing protein [Bacteroidota bacterium]